MPLIVGGTLLVLVLLSQAGTDPTDSAVEGITGFVFRGSNGVTVAKVGHLVTISGSGGGGGGGGGAQTEHLRAQVFAAHGTTDTKIPRYSTTITNAFAAGTATYTTNATEGTTFTVLKAGVYALTIYFDSPQSGPQQCGFSLNADATDRTTMILSVGGRTNLGFAHTAAIGGNLEQGPSYSVTIPLVSNDVVRPHTRGDSPADSTACGMVITKVSD